MSTNPPIKTPKLRITCDGCKLRKVRCIKDGRPGAVCEQCVRHGIPCTTTPHVRKKMEARGGRRIELAKQGTTSQLAPSERQLSLLAAPEHQLAVNQLSWHLAMHLVAQFRQLPQELLNLFDHALLVEQVNSVQGHLDLLPPTTQVLSRTIIALTSLHSSHPLLFSHGPPIPTYDQPHQIPPPQDLRPFARRRKAVCDELKEQAVMAAWKNGTMAVGGRENAASCFLLDTLISVTDSAAAKPYSAAFVTHVRELAVTSPDLEIEWPFLILLEADRALATGSTAYFTEADQLQLCGGKPDSLESCAREAAAGTCFNPIDAFLKPFVYHMTRLARECVISLLCTFARSQPLSESFVIEYIVALEQLNTIRRLLDATAVKLILMRGGQPRQTDGKEPSLTVTRNLYNLIWASLILPVVRELQRRIAELDQQDETTDQLSRSERRWTRDRIAVLLREVTSRLARTAASVVAERVHETPSLSWLTPAVVPMPLGEWAKILMMTPCVEGDPMGFTSARKEEQLRWLHNAMLLSGWATTSPEADRDIGVLELYLASSSQPPTNTNTHFSTSHTVQSPYPDCPLDLNLLPAHISEYPSSARSTSSGVASSSTTPLPVYQEPYPPLDWSQTDSGGFPPFWPLETPIDSSNLASFATPFDPSTLSGYDPNFFA